MGWVGSSQSGQDTVKVFGDEFCRVISDGNNGVARVVKFT